MNLESASPIGVFDSGLGGLSVVAAIRNLMPGENLIYYGDSANAPYGEKSPEQVLQLSIAVCDILVGQGVKAIVVACNTATSAAINALRERYAIPVIGMEPALKPAVEQTATGAVAVLATALTLREAKFQQLLKQYQAVRRIFPVPCPELVTLVESGILSGKEAEKAVGRILGNLENENLSAVVLGCTHYVFLKQVFEKALGKKALIIDGNRGTVLHLKKQLEGRQQLASSLRSGTVEIENSAGEAMIERSWLLLENYRILEDTRNAGAL